MTVLDYGIDTLFDEPWYEGAATISSAEVPGIYQVALNGHGYVIEPSAYSRVTLPLRRESTDESVEPGEQTLNTGGAWRRSQDNWFLGAGQEYLDNRFAFVSVYTHSGESPSVRTRFWRSMGVDPWTEGALSLLPEYGLGQACTDSPLMESMGDYTYAAMTISGTLQLRKMSANLVTNTAIAQPTAWGGGTTWPTISSITSDGSNLYIACGSYGIAALADGSSTPTVLRPTGPTPTVTPKGTVGTTTYTYYVVAVDPNGYKSLVSSAGTTTTGNASLTTGNYNEITWAAVAGTDHYEILKTDTAHTIGSTTGLSFTDDGTPTSTAYTAPTTTTLNFQATFVLYANGFLLGGALNQLASVAANGTTADVLTHHNSTFRWGFGADSPGNIYVGGTGGNKSELYGVQLSTVTFTLGSPYVAGQVPAGETINDVLYYEGLVILATSQGIRTAQASGTNGYLTMGPVITNLGESKCLAVYGSFVYFGISNYAENDGVWQGSTTTSGLGRLSLSIYSSPLVPGFATDVLATVGGTCTSVAIASDGTPRFGIGTSGVWHPTGNLVPQGWLESGWVRYGTVEDKFLINTEVRHLPLEGEVEIEIVPFGDAAASRISTTSTEQGSTAPSYYSSAGLLVGEAFMVIPILTRSSTDATKGPTLNRWTARAMVVALRQDQIVVPIKWANEVLNPQGDGSAIQMNLEEEWQFLKGLETSGATFNYQEGSQIYTAFIDQIETKALQWNDQKTMLEGILSVKLLTVV